MRIIAGEFASRKLVTLKGDHTRPTLDKVKEAIFSSLGEFFDGGVCLDLYAGSGAIGLEALSRGMEKAIFVDNSGKAITVIKENIELLGVKERSHVFKMNALKALEKMKEENQQFRLIYLDPPYEKQQNETILNYISSNHLLDEDGVVVVEALKEDVLPEHIKTLRKTKEATYGITKIHYYRKDLIL